MSKRENKGKGYLRDVMKSRDVVEGGGKERIQLKFTWRESVGKSCGGRGREKGEGRGTEDGRRGREKEGLKRNEEEWMVGRERKSER